MRKMIISMLLASVVATPVMAGPREDRAAAREAAREKRDSAREERRAKTSSSESTTATAPAREVRQQRIEERDQRRSAPAAAVVPTTDPSARESARQRVEQRRGQVNQQRVDRGTTARQSQQQVIDRRQQATDRRVTARERAEQTKERFREIREARRNAPPPPISRTPRPGTQPPPPPQTSRPTPPVNWNTSWRNDHRYDWHDYRRRYSWLFNLGFYYDPFGWNYYPYSIGYRMWPSYYSSSFWLNDPWQYRLPYAPPGTRWIRYYDDAILVDMWSGQVLDVIYDFFW